MRSALWASLAVLVLASASCGGGTEDMSADNPTAGTTAGGGGMAGGGTGGMGGMSGVGGSVCGDRIIDPMANEQCEPTLPHNLTCEGLGMGRGMIMCSSTCRLMMMCAPPENVGGNGGGMAGTGG